MDDALGSKMVGLNETLLIDFLTSCNNNMEQYFVELGVSKYDHINKESELDSFQIENNDCTD